MDDPIAQRKRAIQFSDQVKLKLDSEFGDKIQWEGASPPSLKFLMVRSKKTEMTLEYNATTDMFSLYDRDAKTQTGSILEEFSPVNITTPNDLTPSKVVNAVKSYTD